MAQAETILVIEDEKMLLRAWRQFLEKRSYRVLCAENGEQAIQMYLGHQEKIALILLDLGLPKIGGREVYLKVKEVDPKAKVLIISGYIDPDLLAEMRKVGARDFLQKPVLPEKVLEKIREVLDRPASPV